MNLLTRLHKIHTAGNVYWHSLGQAQPPSQPQGPVLGLIFSGFPHGCLSVMDFSRMPRYSAFISICLHKAYAVKQTRSCLSLSQASWSIKLRIICTDQQRFRQGSLPVLLGDAGDMWIRCCITEPLPISRLHWAFVPIYLQGGYMTMSIHPCLLVGFVYAFST